jgi:hypothetical protein
MFPADTGTVAFFNGDGEGKNRPKKGADLIFRIM